MIFKLNQQNEDSAWRLAKSVLLKGKVIVCPTDTLYGFSALATKSAAIKKIYRLKDRQGKAGAIILVSSLAMLKRYAFVSRAQEAWLRQVWPGKVSVILKSKNNLPKAILGQDKSLAVRLPKNPFLIKLIKQLNCPIISTSVNHTGEAPLIDINDFTKYFPDKAVALIVDSGKLKSKASRLVDLRDYPEIKVLRH